MRPSLYLVDSYGIIYRSYFAFMTKPLRNPEGMNVSAAFGYFRFLFALLDNYHPGAVAAIFDSRGPTFRHEFYTEYKATRQKTPEDLHAQVPLVEEILGALGMPVLRVEGYEADDIIATLARRCAQEGRECRIVSADKDLLQLVGGSVRALRPAEGFSFRDMGIDEVKAEWGVEPERILDYLALTGDSSDNIPGVAGIGDKTALKLLLEYRDLDDIYTSLAQIKPDSLKRKLEAGKDSAILSRHLVTLAENVPLAVGIDELSVSGLDYPKADPLFLREGMRSLTGRGGSKASLPSRTQEAPPGFRLEPETSTLAGGVSKQGTNPSPESEIEPEASSESPRELQDSILPDIPSGDQHKTEGLAGAGDYATILDLDTLSSWIDRCIAAGICAFDCETDGLDELSARMVGFSLCHEARKACYVPLRAPDATCIPKAEAMAQLARLFASGATIIGHNIKFDWHILRRSGAGVPRRLFDTMVAAWMLDSEETSYSLEQVARTRLGYEGISYDSIVPKGSTFDMVPLTTASVYAAEDADLTWRIHSILAPELESAGLANLFGSLEMEVLPILASMEERGIPVNPAELRSYGKQLDIGLESLHKEIIELVGHDFNIASTKQLQEVLFTERKLPAGKKTKTGYSTDTSVLEELAALDPVPAKILRHRSLAKLKSTYVDTLASLAEEQIAQDAGTPGLPGFLTPDPSATGRIHTHFLQTGAATGRLSSRDPNLQNIPIRDEEGRRIRAAFVASPGCILVSADYSQIELVVLAHLSGDPGLAAAFRDGVDVHRRTASLIFGIPESEVTPDRRRIAKTINFGVIYGMSAFRLARDLGLPRSEAQAFIDLYFTTYAGVQGFIASAVAEAEKTGYATTILGRRRPIHAINSRNKTEKSAAERVAVNTPIQGSAADIVKLAMIRVERALAAAAPEAKLLLQVHDELIVECPEASADSVSTILRTEMESAMHLDVPLRVGIEAAPRWGDMH